MKDTLISIKTAIIAKEKECLFETSKYWANYYLNHPLNKWKLILEKDCSMSWNEFPAYPQSLLAKYLREKHNIHIYVIPSDFINDSSKTLYKGVCINHFELEDFESFEEAMEETLYQALLLIKLKT